MKMTHFLDVFLRILTKNLQNKVDNKVIYSRSSNLKRFAFSSKLGRSLVIIFFFGFLLKDGSIISFYQCLSLTLPNHLNMQIEIMNEV